MEPGWLGCLFQRMHACACLRLQSLAEALGPALDAEMEAFVPLLLKRAGQVRIGSRDCCATQNRACHTEFAACLSAAGILGEPTLARRPATLFAAHSRPLVIASPKDTCLPGCLPGCLPPCFPSPQVSISGRDNFLAAEADRALAALVAHAGEARCAAALLSCLASKSPDVRAKAAMHLDACLQQHGSRLVGSVSISAGGGSAGGVPLALRLLRAAVALLDEGGLEARTAGKRMLFELQGRLDAAAASGACDDFKRCLARLECKTDKVGMHRVQVLDSSKADRGATGLFVVCTGPTQASSVKSCTRRALLLRRKLFLDPSMR